MGLRAMFFVLAVLPACSFDAPGLSEGPSLVAFWSFDVDATDAAGAHDGNLAGNAAITSGNRGFGGGEALELVGNGDRVDVGNPELFDFNSDFTWHAYIQTTQRSGALFSRNPIASEWNQGSKALFVRGGSVQWDTGWVGNPETEVDVDDGEWHQVIVTYTAETDAFEIYVDPSVGDRTGSFSTIHNVNRYDEHTHNHNDGLAETGFSIGEATITSGLPNLDTLAGLIDEAAVFDGALTGAELDTLISGGPKAF